MNVPFSARTLAWVMLTASATPAADWPQFRGPQASGLDSTRSLPVDWDAPSGRNIKWQTPIPGLGHASPIVSSNTIYIATAVGPGEAELKVGLYGDIEPLEEKVSHQWRLLAIAPANGKILWNVLAHEGVPKVKRHPKASHCNSTPASDGRYIVTILGSEGLFCFDAQGKRVWKRDLGPMDSGYFSVPAAQWGFASSPVIHRGKVLVLCDVQTNSFLAAYALETGEEIWRTPRSDVPTWGSPTVVESAGRNQVVVNGWRHSGGYEFSTGKELWRLTSGGDIPVPTPIVARGLIYLTSAHGKLRPMRAIRPSATGDITDSSGSKAVDQPIAWEHLRQGNYMQTPIAVSNWVFGCNDNGVVSCFDADNGKILFSERLGVRQGYTASPVSDGRHLYFPGELGKVLVVQVSDKFSTVATNDLGDLCMTVPAIYQGTLLFRTRGKLMAVASN